MKKHLNYGLFVGALCLAFAGGPSALAQAPGGAPQSSPQSSPQSQPNMNGAGNRAGADNPANTPDATAAAPRKMDDKKFAKDAAIGGMTEVELGKLAAQKGSSDAVKQFGQKMVDDHTKANDQLKEVAQKGNMSIPSGLDSKHQSRVDKLSKLSGPAFDKAYVKDQLKDHEKDVSAFKSEAETGTDPNIKQFASSTLPVLEQHLSMIKELNDKAKSGGSK